MTKNTTQKYPETYDIANEGRSSITLKSTKIVFVRTSLQTPLEELTALPIPPYSRLGMGQPLPSPVLTSNPLWVSFRSPPRTKCWRRHLSYCIGYQQQQPTALSWQCVKLITVISYQWVSCMHAAWAVGYFDVSCDAISLCIWFANNSTLTAAYY